MEQKDVVIIGGGPAGLAAAVELHKQGIRNMIILEREAMLGGILRQCIHDGFGLGQAHAAVFQCAAGKLAGAGGRSTGQVQRFQQALGHGVAAVD